MQSTIIHIEGIEIPITCGIRFIKEAKTFYSMPTMNMLLGHIQSLFPTQVPNENGGFDFVENPNHDITDVTFDLVLLAHKAYCKGAKVAETFNEEVFLDILDNGIATNLSYLLESFIEHFTFCMNFGLKPENETDKKKVIPIPNH